MSNPVTHFEIAGRDGQKLQQFYRDLFGWHVNADNPMQYGLVDTHSESGIGGGVMAAPEGQPPHLTIYIDVDDLDATLLKVEAAGGKTVVPPTVVPDMVTFAVFADPEGHRICLKTEMAH